MTGPPAGHGYIDHVDGEEHFWRIETLWAAARDLPVRQTPLDEIAWSADGCHVLGDPPTWGEIAGHCRRAMAADLERPIILNANGDVMDGMHRLIKAHVLGRATVPAVRFAAPPPPDRVRPLPTPAKDASD